MPMAQEQDSSIIAESRHVDPQTPRANAWYGIALQGGLGELQADQHIIILSREFPIGPDSHDVRVFPKFAHQPRPVLRIDQGAILTPKMECGIFAPVLLMAGGEAPTIPRSGCPPLTPVPLRGERPLCRFVGRFKDARGFLEDEQQGPRRPMEPAQCLRALFA